MADRRGKGDSPESGWSSEGHGRLHENQFEFFVNNPSIEDVEPCEGPERQYEGQLINPIRNLCGEHSVKSELSVSTPFISLDDFSEELSHQFEEQSNLHSNLNMGIAKIFDRPGRQYEDQSELGISNLNMGVAESFDRPGRQNDDQSERAISNLNIGASESSDGNSRLHEEQLKLFFKNLNIGVSESSEEPGHQYKDQSILSISNLNAESSEWPFHQYEQQSISNLNAESSEWPFHQYEQLSISNLNAESSEWPLHQYEQQSIRNLNAEYSKWSFRKYEESEISVSTPIISLNQTSHKPGCQYEVQSNLLSNLNIGTTESSEGPDLQHMEQSEVSISDHNAEFLEGLNCQRKEESTQIILLESSDEEQSNLLSNLNIGAAESVKGPGLQYVEPSELSIINHNVEFSEGLGSKHNEESKLSLGTQIILLQSSNEPGRQYEEQSNLLSDLNMGAAESPEGFDSLYEEQSHLLSDLNTGVAVSSNKHDRLHEEQSEFTSSNQSVRVAESLKGPGRLHEEQSEFSFSNQSVIVAQSLKGPGCLHEEQSEFSFSNQSVKVAESLKGPGRQYEEQSEFASSNLSIGVAESSEGPACLCVEECKLVISNLSSSVSDVDMYDLFNEFGSIRSSNIIYDSAGRSLGSAQVEYFQRSDAMTALKQLSGAVLDGWALKIKISSKCEQDNVNGKILLGLEQEKLDTVSQVTTGQELEDVKTNVRFRFINKIEEINDKIDDRKRRYNDHVLNQKSELKKKQAWEWGYLIRKHNNEEKNLIEKYREENKNLFRKQLEEKTKLDARHTDEEASIEKNYRKAEGDENYLTSLRKMREQLLKDLDGVDIEPRDCASSNDHRNIQSARETLECPICLEFMSPPTRIWMCPSSHIVCEPCWNILKGKFCPTCRTERVTRRAFVAENFARSVFNEGDGNRS